MRNRAVSDTVGFVLIFALVVSTVGVVYVGGFQALDGARDTQRFANTERAFDVMDANLEDVAVRGAPRRTTEILLSDATLSFGSPVTFNVTDGGSNYYSTTVRPILYEGATGNELVYSNGALFRQYEDAAIMFDEPRFADGDRTFIPYVVTRPASENVSTSSTRRLLVRTTHRAHDVHTFNTTGLSLNVTSPRAAAWERYLEDEFDVDCTGPADGTSGYVRCPLDANDVYVQAVVVDVAYT